MTDAIRGRVARHLEVLYPGRVDQSLVDAVLRAVGLDPATPSSVTDPADPADPVTRWDEGSAVLITYADTVGDGAAPLATLSQLLSAELAGVASVVHVLPFYPWSSDDGFAVIDHHDVEPILGSWADISALADKAAVMADLVINHRSASSAEFAAFVRGESPGRDRFVTASPEADLSPIIRPRTHQLLRAVETAAGPRHVWCTFSHDQPDLDFGNPEVLLDTLRVVDRLITAGVTWLRLDAVAYVWKQLGTSCIHLPQTHELVKLVRTLLSSREPRAVVVTETNVPHDENVSYLGDGDEAHVVYNFSLPPLLVHAALTGDTAPLHRWLAATAPPPAGTTMLNFIASHDGIGVRPAEGLLTDGQIDALVGAAHEAGGLHSDYSTPNGPRPYELNVSLFDLLGGAERNLAAHTVMMCLAGVPAFYVHALLGTPNDHDGVERRGHNRAINRRTMSRADVAESLAAEGGTRQGMLDELIRRRTLRCTLPAFHPDSPQRPIEVGNGVFGVVRGDGDDRVTCLVNLRDEPVDVQVPTSPESVRTDLLSGTPVGDDRLRLESLQAVWLSDSTAS